MHPPTGSTPQVTFPPGAGHDRYEESFNGPATYAEPYVERYGIKSEFSGREPLHPTPPRPGYVPTLGQTPPSSTQGSVMMVYGLQPDKVNTDKLFNLFCLYGNVTKVKFLKTKEGCAMIQMGDSIAVERCLQNLNNVTIGTDGRLQLGFSKQAFLSDVTNPYILPDKTASFKDFTGSKNNRFLNPAMANKNRIQPPSKIVHFFNTPPDLTEETVNRVFVERGIEAPTTVKLFPLKSERSSSGLIEFSSVGIAVAAIMECNHTALENSTGLGIERRGPGPAASAPAPAPLSRPAPVVCPRCDEHGPAPSHSDNPIPGIATTAGSSSFATCLSPDSNANLVSNCTTSPATSSADVLALLSIAKDVSGILRRPDHHQVTFSSLGIIVVYRRSIRKTLPKGDRSSISSIRGMRSKRWIEQEEDEEEEEEEEEEEMVEVEEKEEED
ncbi:heterogeneous nuclear ribonucleoprotein L isoform X1 [Vespula maculifrons]|uniref:Heterogeneous nuclear ribonucleoprotein L isoform X1 n=1 Tax=Vespula maculifrons TaxID=7453 RepID=A0ABD2D2K4_VESMC